MTTIQNGEPQMTHKINLNKKTGIIILEETTANL
jgi:hypothetical protein